MENIVIPCPKCGSGLRLKDRSNLGKLGRCPKCATRFKLEEPEEVQLELAEAAVPTGTAAQWVPDAGAAPQPAATASNAGIDFPAIADDSPGTGIALKTHPKIEVGMTFAEVSKLLGKPTKRKRMSDLVAQAKKQGKRLPNAADAAKREYVVFGHAAGNYKLIFRDDKVVEIHSQPDGQASAVPTAGTPKTSERARKNKLVGIVMGAVLAVVLFGVMIYAFNTEPPAPAVAEKKEPPKKNETLQKDDEAMQEGLALAKQFVEGEFPTKGELVSFQWIPYGANIVMHLRPAELWSEQPKFAMFRACLTNLILDWAGNGIKEQCLFEPQEIEEALICVLLGGREEPPGIAVRVRLATPRKKSVFLTAFKGEPTSQYGYPIYDDGTHAYLLEQDPSNPKEFDTFAICPSDRAKDMVAARRPTLVSKQGLTEIMAHSDRERHFQVAFQPFDVRVHQHFLVHPDAKGFLNSVLNWLDVDDVETAMWSFHLGDEKFYSELLARENNRREYQVTTRHIHRQLRQKIENLPKDLYASVRRMNPTQVGRRKVIGRFPAMMKVAALQTRDGIDAGMAQFLTVLPAKAAPNLALGSILTWHESLNISSQTPTTNPSDEPKLPALVVDRLKLPFDVDFNRRPLQEAFDDIAEATSVKFEIDGDALKFAGYTKNMPQSFKLGEVPANKAIAEILGQYEKMCVCITDEDKNIVTVMTFDFAKQKGLTPLKFE